MPPGCNALVAIAIFHLAGNAARNILSTRGFTCAILHPMIPTRILLRRLCATLPLALVSSLQGQGISLTSGGFYSQNFDSLPTTPGIGWFNYGTLPGWLAQTDATPNPL